MNLDALHTQVDVQLLRGPLVETPSRTPEHYLEAREFFKYCRVSTVEPGVVRLRCVGRLFLKAWLYLDCFEDTFSFSLGRPVRVTVQPNGGGDGGDDCPQHAKLPPKPPLDLSAQVIFPHRTSQN
jgi:hypothetical protein